MRKPVLAITGAVAAVIGLASAAQAGTTQLPQQSPVTAIPGRTASAAVRVTRIPYVNPGNAENADIIADPCPSGETPGVLGVPPGMYVEVVSIGGHDEIVIYGNTTDLGDYKITVLCGGAAGPSYPLRVVPSPPLSSLIGVGAAGDGNLFDQAGGGYNELRPAAMYSFDATNPVTGATGDPVITKAGCPAIPRPGGSSAGIAALAENTIDPADHNAYCIDFARSVRGRQPTDPPYAPGGVAFVALARDAITWATRDAASGGTSAPKTLTAAQLSAIYQCKVTNWDEVGGADAPVHAFLPQTSSETRAAFLTDLGGITPGACVSDDNNALAENEGVSPALNDPDAIVPYSIAAYLAQAYHSAACLNSSCTAGSSGQACVPANGQDLFSCDETGVLALNEIDNDLPFLPFHPPNPPCIECHINPGFPGQFQDTVYDVVRYDAATDDHIPAYLEPLLAAVTARTSGWLCGKQGQADIADYGYLPAANCGATS